MAQSFLNRSDLPPGLRNNNPGNLRPGIDWQGMIGTNGGFIVFKDIAWGIRAMATDIGNDIRLDGLNTLKKLIYEYAPPSENDTEGYISNMIVYTGFSRDQVLPISEYTLLKLIRGFIKVEVGREYSNLVTDADIQEGVALVNDDLKEYFNISTAGDEPGTSNVGLFIGLIVAAAGLYWWYSEH